MQDIAYACDLGRSSIIFICLIVLMDYSLVPGQYLYLLEQLVDIYQCAFFPASNDNIDKSFWRSFIVYALFTVISFFSTLLIEFKRVRTLTLVLATIISLMVLFMGCTYAGQFMSLD